MAVERQGPFWDMIEGRLPAPPAARLLGWKLDRIDPDQGAIRVQFEGKEEFLNPVGSIQGGILAAMLDDTLGPAAAALLGGEAFAQTLARVVHGGRDIVFLEGSLSTADGTVVATARVIPFQALRSLA